MKLKISFWSHASYRKGYNKLRSLGFKCTGTKDHVLNADQVKINTLINSIFNTGLNVMLIHDEDGMTAFVDHEMFTEEKKTGYKKPFLFKDYINQRSSLHAVKRSIGRMLSEEESSLRKEAARIINKKLSLNLDEHDVGMGVHSCDKSPLSHCVYNLKEDRCRDFCLFCGDPEERK